MNADSATRFEEFRRKVLARELPTQYWFDMWNAAWQAGQQAACDQAQADARALAEALGAWRDAYFGSTYQDPDAPYQDDAISKFQAQYTRLAFAESGLLDALSQHGARYLETEK